MTTAAWIHLVVAVSAAALWLAVYRLPFKNPRTRQRFRLAVSSRLNVPPRQVFPIFGTVFYLVAGIAAIALVSAVSGIDVWQILSWNVSLHGLALTGFAFFGACCLTGFAMSLVYLFRPGVDVPAAVNDVAWIREVMALPARWRWLAPTTSAAVEEMFFRGVLMFGLLAAGAPAWTALAASALVFTVGQTLLTENRLQALVLATSSVVLSTVGGLLLIVEDSVLPAILVHAAFAGFYVDGGSRRTSGSKGASSSR